MLEPSSVLYIFGAVYVVGLLLPFLGPERDQFTSITSIYRPLSLSLIMLHCIAAYLSDLHLILNVLASTTILLLPLSLRQELRDERNKIFGADPFSKMLGLGLMIFILLFLGRLLLGESSEYGYIINILNIPLNILLIIELYKVFRISKSIHILYAIIFSFFVLTILAFRVFLYIYEDNNAFSLVNENFILLSSRLIIGASFFILLNAVTNFQFQKLWNKERALRLDTERASLDSLIALSQARDSETGNRIVRKKKYVGLLIDNLRPKGWLTMPDLDADTEQLFAVGSPKYNANGSAELLEGHAQGASLPGDNDPQTVRLIALADVYDVLTSKRPWKRSWTHKQAIDEITKMAGNRLDPTVVNAFLEEQMAFSAIADVWRDGS
jgi:hypothetical protein